jgi:hypothetical protein
MQTIKRLTVLAILLPLMVLSVGDDRADAATYTVCASGCDFATVQAAVNAAGAGDILELKANETFNETVTLPNKGALTSFITITSDAAAGNLPASGVRINPSFAAFLPKIRSARSGLPAIRTAKGANHYKFQYIDFPNVPGGFNAIFLIGDSSWQFSAEEPSDFVIDQCWFHGDPIAGQKRGVEMNGKNITIWNSYVEKITAVGQDSQCLYSHSGAGPFDIQNNYLECGAENFLLGGGDPLERTFLRATGTPTTTSANVTTYEAGHFLPELKVGQKIAVKTNGGTKVEFTTIRSCSIAGGTACSAAAARTGASGTITFDALSAPPDVPGDMRGGVVPTGLTFRHNHVTKQLSWRNGVLASPTGAGATASTISGSLAAGTRHYSAQAFSNQGYNGNWVNGGLSNEASATLGATGRISVSWSAVIGATTYRVWRGTASGTFTEWSDSPSTTFVDDGTKTWTTATPSASTKWQVKNLFEIKSLINGQIDSNVFTNHWKGVDTGYALWFKSVNQDGQCWWCQTENIVVEKNIIAHVYGWLEVHGQEAFRGSPYPIPLRNVTFRNNLVYDSNANYNNIGERFDQVAIGISDAALAVTLDHNTVVHTMRGLLNLDTNARTYGSGLLGNLVITNNMFRRETYGIHSRSAREGKKALEVDAPGYTFTKNNVGGGLTGNASDGDLWYPATNFLDPVSTWEKHFVTFSADGIGADFRIKAVSTMHHAGTDGKDVGADIDVVNAATTGVLAGTGVDAHNRKAVAGKMRGPSENSSSRRAGR